MWLPRTAVSVDAFHLVKLGNDMLTEVRQGLTQQVHGRRGRSIDPVWASRRLLLRAGDTLSDRARDRLSTVFTSDDATGKLQAAWLVKEQLRAMLATGSLADAAAAKDRLQTLVARAAQPETNRLGRTVCRWWKEFEVLIVIGATTAKVEANNTAIEHPVPGGGPRSRGSAKESAQQLHRKRDNPFASMNRGWISVQLWSSAVSELRMISPGCWALGGRTVRSLLGSLPGARVRATGSGLSAVGSGCAVLSLPS
ncbi:transposase [Pseudarthrobacter sp. Fe7]|nr:transposase [Pseudarthrobacter sp. Fe7]